jgi:uncharacterized protein YyaL (SSP411 family)
VLADWNGLMIAALANTSQVFERPDWLADAVAAFAFVTREMTDEDGRLRHSWRDGRARHPATVDDYANLSRAALALFEATGEAAYRERAEAWARILDRHYWDAAGDGYFFAADDTTDLITRAKTAAENAVPAGNSTMVGVLARLFYLTGKDEYRDKAERIVAAFSGELQRNFFPLVGLVTGAELLSRGLQIVIRGRRGDPATEALRRAVLDQSLPNRILAVVPPDDALPASHPAAGKDQVEGKPTAYVCEGPVCSLPLTDPIALAETLAKR